MSIKLSSQGNIEETRRRQLRRVFSFEPFAAALIAARRALST
jgi:hypothetical protein